MCRNAIVVCVGVILLFAMSAQARWGIRLSRKAALHTSNRPANVPPKDPRFYKKIFGLGHDKAIRQGIREAKRAGDNSARDRRLLQLVQNPNTVSKISRWSVKKITDKTKTIGGSDAVLEGFAKHYIKGLSVGDIVGFSSRLYAIDLKEGMIQRYRTSHSSLSAGAERSLFRAETLSYGGHLGSVAAVYNPRTNTVERRYAYKRDVVGVYNPKKGKVEWGWANHKSSIAGVYNPRTGEVEWKQRYMGGVAGAYNPKDGKVLWASGYHSGAAAVYNPKDGKVHTKVSYMSGVAGAYNPKDGKVYFESSWKGGAGAVYNPSTGKVHTYKGWQDGVAGAYNKRTGKVEWTSNWKGGAAAVFHDGTTYRSNGGFNVFIFEDSL